MQFGEMFYQLKTSAEFTVKGVGVVANNVQTAALGRSLGTESRYDDVTSGSNRTRYLAYVRRTLLGFDQKVEHGPVMPYVVLIGLEGKCSDVTAKPVDRVRSVTKPLLGDIQCGQRNIQNGKITIAAGE